MAITQTAALLSQCCLILLKKTLTHAIPHSHFPTIGFQPFYKVVRKNLRMEFGQIKNLNNRDKV